MAGDGRWARALTTAMQWRGGWREAEREREWKRSSPRYASVCCPCALHFCAGFCDFFFSNFFLFPVQSHHELKPTRDESVDLRLAVATKIKNHEFAPFCMSLTMRDKGSLVYLLFADSEAVRDVWLECFASATQTPVLAK